MFILENNMQNLLLLFRQAPLTSPVTRVAQTMVWLSVPRTYTVLCATRHRDLVRGMTNPALIIHDLGVQPYGYPLIRIVADHVHGPLEIIMIEYDGLEQTYVEELIDNKH